MMSIDEMRTLLRVEFGINSEAELEKQLQEIGGIRIAIFTDKPSKEAHDEKGTFCKMVS